MREQRAAPAALATADDRRQEPDPARADAARRQPRRRRAASSSCATRTGTRAASARSRSAPEAASLSRACRIAASTSALPSSQGVGLCWLPPKGLAGTVVLRGRPRRYAWLRVGLGGLFNTAGLVSIGVPAGGRHVVVRVHAALTARYGTHDRIAVTPASRFDVRRATGTATAASSTSRGSCGRTSPTARTCRSARRYETELGSSSVTLVDDGRTTAGSTTPHQLLYHFNLGYPLVDDGCGAARVGRGGARVARLRRRRRRAGRLAERDRAAARLHVRRLRA